MKRLLYGLLVGMAALAMVSCKGEPGRDGRDGLVNYYNIPLVVNQNDWGYSNTKDSLNNYFYATFNMPEITKDLYEHSNVMVYRVLDNANQTPLPQTRHNEYWDKKNNEILFYTETVDYEYSVGEMTIYYTVSDFNYEVDLNFVPETMNFRVFIMF